MQRYFSNNKDSNELFLNNDDIYHIKTVMRLKTSDLVEIVYNNKLYICEIEDNYRFMIKEEIDIKKTDKPYVVLVIPLLKEAKMDLILQKATELGVSEIIPIITARSVIKVTGKEEKKLARWNKIVKEASEQSKRLDIPKITEIKKIEELEIDGKKFLCSVNEKKTTIKKVLSNISIYDKIVFTIGPEGGFENREEEILHDLGFKRISLGDNVLRVETVPLFILSVINYNLMR